MWENDIFYNPLSVRNFKEFKKDVISESYDIFLEEKYKKSNRREPTTKSLNWILEKSKLENVKIVHRMKRPLCEERFEIVFFYDWYFAWCDIKLEKENYFVNKYNLKKLN